VASGLSHLAVPLAPAYAMSKRGLVAYSDSLRYEHGDAITVTTVYPGYIRTPIHEAAAAEGITLDGLVPVERVEQAAGALVRAALAHRAPRDLATTWRGTVGYALLRLAPRRLVDAVMLRHLRRAAASGHFDDSRIAGSLRTRLLGRTGAYRV
jgi:NAD(P)-dependent dehydrogenase (short-subunit alcohol dehydrogenase family)